MRWFLGHGNIKDHIATTFVSVRKGKASKEVLVLKVGFSRFGSTHNFVGAVLGGAFGCQFCLFFFSRW